MDDILHQVGKDLLLTRRKDLHAAHRLQRLPQLPAREQQTCTQPTVNTDREAAGLRLHVACEAGSTSLCVSQSAKSCACTFILCLLNKNTCTVGVLCQLPLLQGVGSLVAMWYAAL